MWRKSRFCNGAAACVEVSEPSEETGGMWQIRDSKDPDGPVLSFTKGEFEAFAAGVKNGEFDGVALGLAMDGPGGDAPRRPPASTESGSGAVSVHG